MQTPGIVYNLAEHNNVTQSEPIWNDVREEKKKKQQQFQYFVWDPVLDDDDDGMEKKKYSPK